MDLNASYKSSKQQYKDLSEIPEEFFRSYGLEQKDFEQAGCVLVDHYFSGETKLTLPAVRYPYINKFGIIRYKYKSVGRVLKDGTKRACAMDRNTDKKPEYELGVFGLTMKRLETSEQPLYIVGGEEKARLTNRLSFRSVCLKSGEMSVSQDVASWLVKDLGNKEIIINMDNDAAGAEGNITYAKAFCKAGATVRIVQWLTDFEGSDINEYCKQHGEDAAKTLLQNVKDYNPEEQKQADQNRVLAFCRSSGDLINDSTIQPPEWFYDGLIRAGGIILAAEEKAGKTRLMMQAAYSVIQHRSFLGCKCLLPENESSGVIWLNYDMLDSELKDYTKSVSDAMQVSEQDKESLMFMNCIDADYYINEQPEAINGIID